MCLKLLQDAASNHDICHAVVDPRNSLRLNETLEIFGWGWQKANMQQPVKDLAGLPVNTINCTSHLPAAYLNHAWLNSLGEDRFYCIGAPSEVGGPCTGDEGGEGMCNDTFHVCSAYVIL